MLKREDEDFLRQAKQQASSEFELTVMIRAYAEQEEGDCLLCKQLLLKELIEAVN